MVRHFLCDNRDFLSEVKYNQYDWVIDDPPYFSGPEKREFYGKEISTTGAKRAQYNISKWEAPGPDYFEKVIEVSKNQIIWGCNYFNYVFGPGRIIWDKCNYASSYSDVELAYCSAFYSTRLFRYMWNGMCQGKSIEEGHIMQGNKKLNEKRIHQTQKPVALYGWTYKTFIPKGAKVLDLHGGSFSHAIAAEKLGYDLDIVEIDPNVYERGVERYRKETFSMFK